MKIFSEIFFWKVQAGQTVDLRGTCVQKNQKYPETSTGLPEYMADATLLGNA